MMSKLGELEVQEQQFKEAVDITPSGESVLANLGIKPTELKSINPHWQRTQYRAVINWLTKYKIHPDASNLEKVRGFIEAFHHLCEVEAWDKTWEILNIRLNTPMNKELHEQLNFWGEYRQQIQLYKQIINQVNPTRNTQLLNDMGKAYYDLGDNDSADIDHKKALSLALKFNNQEQQGLALRGLGKVCIRRNNLDRAGNYFEQQLEIAKAIDDKKQLIMAMQNIALVRLNSPKPQDSPSLYKDIIEQLFEPTLRLCQEINDQKSEAIGLEGLGDCYVRLGDNSRAINCYCQALEIYETIQDSRSINNLDFKFGDVCFKQSSFEESVIYLERYVNFCDEGFEKKYNPQRLMNSYRNLSEVLNIIYRDDEALKYADKLFDLAKKTADKYSAFYLYGNIYSSLGQLEKALNNYESSLQCANEINDLEKIIDSLISIAHCYNDMGNYRYALRYSNQARKKSNPKHLVDDKNLRDRFSYALGEFGVACRELGKYDVAEKIITKAFEIARESDDKLNKAVEKRDLGLTYLAIGDYDRALNDLRESQAILQDMCCPEEQFRTFLAISQFYLKSSDYNQSLLYYEIAKNTASKLSPVFQIKCDHLKLQIDTEMSDR